MYSEKCNLSVAKTFFCFHASDYIICLCCFPPPPLEGRGAGGRGRLRVSPSGGERVWRASGYAQRKWLKGRAPRQFQTKEQTTTHVEAAGAGGRGRGRSAPPPIEHAHFFSVLFAEQSTEKNDGVYKVPHLLKLPVPEPKRAEPAGVF